MGWWWPAINSTIKQQASVCKGFLTTTWKIQFYTLCRAGKDNINANQLFKKTYYQTQGSLRRCSKLLLYNRLEFKSYSIIINKCSRVDGDSFTWNSATVDRLKYTRQPIPFNESLQLKMPFLHFYALSRKLFVYFIHQECRALVPPWLSIYTLHSSWHGVDSAKIKTFSYYLFLHRKRSIIVWEK